MFSAGPESPARDAVLPVAVAPAVLPVAPAAVLPPIPLDEDDDAALSSLPVIST